MAKNATTSVWCVRDGRITEVPGCRLGKEMVTLPSGQRWARNGHGIDGYYETQIAAARSFKKDVLALIEGCRQRLATYESVNADCDRILEADRVAMHRIVADVRGQFVADYMYGKVESVIDSPRDAAMGVDRG